MQQTLIDSDGKKTSVEGGIGCTHEEVSETPHVEECVLYKRGWPSPRNTQYVGFNAIVLVQQQCGYRVKSLRRNKTTKNKN